MTDNPPAKPVRVRHGRPASMDRAANPAINLAVNLAGALGVAWALAGCGSLWPPKSVQPAIYSLQTMKGEAAIRHGEPTPSLAPARAFASSVLVVQVPLAAPGFDTSHIVYTQQPNRLQIYARHEWIDTPAKMLAPLVVAALEQAGSFSAVVLAPSAATGSVQLETQLLRLQHEFGPAPSRVRLVLRAQLIDTRSRQVMATRVFEQVAPSLSEDAPGGVAAAQQAVHSLLVALSQWCQGVVNPVP
jgi:cholesterol transport system auxiliary component